MKSVSFQTPQPVAQKILRQCTDSQMSFLHTGLTSESLVEMLRRWSKLVESEQQLKKVVGQTYRSPSSASPSPQLAIRNDQGIEKAFRFTKSPQTWTSSTLNGEAIQRIFGVSFGWWGVDGRVRCCEVHCRAYCADFTVWSPNFGLHTVWRVHCKINRFSPWRM